MPLDYQLGRNAQGIQAAFICGFCCFSPSAFSVGLEPVPTDPEGWIVLFTVTVTFDFILALCEGNLSSNKFKISCI